MHHLRMLVGVFVYAPRRCRPFVMVTAAGAQSVNALTGPADHFRHEAQWQYPIATGAPTTRSSTSPQKQLPLCSFSVDMTPPLRGSVSRYRHVMTMGREGATENVRASEGRVRESELRSLTPWRELFRCDRAQAP